MLIQNIYLNVNNMKVLIVGIRNIHLLKLKQLFPTIIFKAYLDQDNHSNVNPFNGSFDYVLSMYRFTKHSTERNCSSHSGYIRVNSYSHIKQILSQHVKG